MKNLYANCTSADHSALDGEIIGRTIGVVVDRLLRLQLPPLPVAPMQDANRYPLRDNQGNIVPDEQGNPKPMFTGKNPSYLDRSGKPHLIKHSDFGKRLPTKNELRQWFANPLNGIGTLGGINQLYWLDLDSKHFDSPEALKNWVDVWIEQYPKLSNGWREITQSGGFRALFKLPDAPDFTNFALSPGGEHVGEIIGKGRFVVLAPTVGVSGNAYTNLQYGDPIELNDLSEVGIYSTKKPKLEPVTIRPIANLPVGGDVVALEDLIGGKAGEILRGGNPEQGHRSDDLATLANEAFGWENYCYQTGVRLNGSAQDLLHSVGNSWGLDERRIDRIIKTIDATSCQPACITRGGEESAEAKIKRLLGIGKSNRSQVNQPENTRPPDTPLLQEIRAKFEGQKPENRNKWFFEILHNWKLMKLPKGTLIEHCKALVVLAVEQFPKEDQYALWKSISNLCKIRVIDVQGWVKGVASGDSDAPDRLCDMLQLKRSIEHHTANELKLNQLKQQLEFRGQPIKAGRYKLFLAELLNQDVSRDDATELLGAIGEANAYHPVKDYLESVYELYGNSTIDLLEAPSTRLLGTGNELYDLYLRNRMVASVARIYDPGCKVDEFTVLQGGQGLMKSAFWKTLFGADFFSDSLGADLHNKDELMKLHSTWCMEIDELDRVTNYKEASLIKSFATRSKDVFRAPYERAPEEHPRMVSVVATVNKVEFLVDETGNRRFQVIPITQRINLQRVEEERDRLWAAAVARYKRGDAWHLTQDQEALAAIDTSRYESTDLWENIVAEYLSNPQSWILKDETPHVLPEQVLINALKFDQSRIGHAEKKRLSCILRKLGWEPANEGKVLKLPTLGNRPVRAWAKVTVKETVTEPLPPTVTTSKPYDSTLSKKGNGSNGCSIGVVGKESIPDSITGVERDMYSSEIFSSQEPLLPLPPEVEIQNPSLDWVLTGNSSVTVESNGQKTTVTKFKVGEIVRQTNVAPCRWVEVVGYSSADSNLARVRQFADQTPDQTCLVSVAYLMPSKSAPRSLPNQSSRVS